MCRLLKNHPVKSIFVILITISVIHLIYKVFFTDSTPYNIVSSNIPVIYHNKIVNNTSEQSLSETISNKSAECKIDVNNLKSSITANQEPVSLESLEHANWSTDVIDGHWSPKNCTPTDTVAIIIPYRNRERHLGIFLRHIHPFLQKQLISYGIFIIEQAEGTRFNRASLFNVGYSEAINEGTLSYNCFIFHDVDLLPTNENNLYKCSENPMHLSVAIDKFNYKLPYNAIFGGAVALSREQFQKVNGFSNIFFGWGGEDDDMSYRLNAVKYSIWRYPNSVARYVMIRHSGDKGNPANDARWKLLKDSTQRYKTDGISSLIYSKLPSVVQSKLVKFITVQFPEKEILKKWKL